MSRKFNLTIHSCAECPYSDGFSDECLHDDAFEAKPTVSYMEVPENCPELLSRWDEYTGKETESTKNIKITKTPLRWKR